MHAGGEVRVSASSSRSAAVAERSVRREAGSALVKMPNRLVRAPMSYETADRENDPVVVYALNMEPKKLAMPRPTTSCVTWITYLPFLAAHNEDVSAWPDAAAAEVAGLELLRMSHRAPWQC